MMQGIMGGYLSYMALNYRDCLSAQNKPYTLDADDSYANCLTWLVNVPELFSSRAPGKTCLSAMRSGKTGPSKSPSTTARAAS